MNSDQILEYFADFDTFSVDTETSSLYPWRDGEILAGMSIKPLGGHAFYFPFYHGDDALPGKHGTTDPHNLPLSWFHDIWNFLLGKNNKFIFHNAKFDMAVLFNEGIDLTGENVYDTVVLMRLVNENEMSYELKDIAYRFIDDNARKEQNKIRKYLRDYNCDNYAQIPANFIAEYARRDVVYTEWIFCYAMDRIEDRGLWELLELEQRVTMRLFEIERKGILVDRKFVEKRMKALIPEHDKAQVVCYTQVQESLKTRWKKKKSLSEHDVARLDIAVDLLKGQDGGFKIHSAYDVRKVFKGMGISSGVETATGGESWAKAALKIVAKNHPNKTARLLAENISIVRALNKIIVDYYGKILQMMDANDVIHASLHQAGTRTGRLSCREPNLQNIPKGGTFDLLEFGDMVDETLGTEVRDAFIPRPGCFLLMADWSQIELRILAEYAEDELWKRAFHYGVDIHKVAARSAFGEEPEDPDEAYLWRQKGKNLNFAVVYGVGNAKLGEALGVSAAKAKKFKAAYFEQYPAIKKFSDLSKSVCQKRTMRVCKLHINPLCQECDAWINKGWVRNKYGRRRYLEVDQTYIALNFLIQGSNGDLLKDTFDRTQESLDKLVSSVLNLVHDEEISEIPYAESEEAIGCIVHEMITTDKFDIPIQVGLQWSPERWGKAESLDCETCHGNGKIFPFAEREMAELVYQRKWDMIEEAGIEVCPNCKGKCYETSKIQAHWKKLQEET